MLTIVIVKLWYVHCFEIVFQNIQAINSYRNVAVRDPRSVVASYWYILLLFHSQNNDPFFFVSRLKLITVSDRQFNAMLFKIPSMEITSK